MEKQSKGRKEPRDTRVGDDKRHAMDQQDPWDTSRIPMGHSMASNSQAKLLHNEWTLESLPDELLDTDE